MTVIDFTCSVCGKRFVIPSEDYRGQFDHPPHEPVCNDCHDLQQMREMERLCVGAGYKIRPQT